MRGHRAAGATGPSPRCRRRGFSVVASKMKTAVRLTLLRAILPRAAVPGKSVPLASIIRHTRIVKLRSPTRNASHAAVTFCLIATSNRRRAPAVFPSSRRSSVPLNRLHDASQKGCSLAPKPVGLVEKCTRGGGELGRPLGPPAAGARLHDGPSRAASSAPRAGFRGRRGRPRRRGRRPSCGRGAVAEPGPGRARGVHEGVLRAPTQAGRSGARGGEAAVQWEGVAAGALRGAVEAVFEEHGERRASVMAALGPAASCMK